MMYWDTKFYFSQNNGQDCRTGPEADLSFLNILKISIDLCECLCNSVVESLLGKPRVASSNPGEGNIFFSKSDYVEQRWLISLLFFYQKLPFEICTYHYYTTLKNFLIHSFISRTKQCTEKLAFLYSFTSMLTRLCK